MRLSALTALALAAALPGQVLAAGKPAAAKVPVAAPPSLPPVPAGKLGDAVVPKAYRIDLTVDPAKERFSGQVEIDAILKQAASHIDLHGRNLAIRLATARAGGRTFTGTWRQADDTGTSRLTFSEPLPAGPVTLAFDYDAAFNDGPAGMFRVKVGEDWYSWTQHQSIDARAVFPGFDEPGFKTPFTVTLRTRPGRLAVSNARQVSRTLENGLDVHRFEATLPLPTYLTAFMTGPFVVAESAAPPTPQRADPLPLRVIATRPNADKLSFALEASKEIVAHLEDYFGEAFPYPKLDQIATPILPGAMENAGADLYDDSILLLDEKASVSRKRNFGMVVSHELAHQWFGDLVTPAWWDDIWLNESFANWMGYRIGDQWRPDLKIGAGALAEGFDAMSADELIAGRPIRQAIDTSNQINSAFDSITYGKGGHVVAMIAGFMGDEKFRLGVQRHLRAHRHGNATSENFYAALADAAGDDRIVPAMQGFTGQQGVPLLTFARQGSGWTVQQSRYAPLGVSAPAARWMVPVCLRQGETRQCSLLAEESASLSIEGKGPLVPNAGGTGYYRFELPEREWKALIGMAESLPGGEALAAADSLSASFRAGRSSARQLVNLAKNLVRNPDSHASAAGSGLLAWLASADLIDDQTMPAFRSAVGRLYRPILKRSGFDPSAGVYAGEHPEASQRRAIAVSRLAGLARDKGLRGQLAVAADRFMAGDKAALDPAWYGRAFDVWLTLRGMSGAKTLAEQAVASEDPVLRPAALGALAASGDEANAKWLLDEFKDPRLRLSEKRNALGGILLTRTTRELGYRWLSANLASLLAGDSGIFFSARLPQILGDFCSAERADEFARDLRPRLAGTPGALELERVIEQVRNCGNLSKARKAEVTAQLAGIR